MHDPTFTAQHTHASITSQRSALISASRPQYEEGDIEGWVDIYLVRGITSYSSTTGMARIHINTERWRVCETYFSPGMAGVDSAGLGEVLQSILSRFSESEKARLVKVGFFVSAFPATTHARAECIHHRRSIAIPWSSRKTLWNASSDSAARDAHR